MFDCCFVAGRSCQACHANQLFAVSLAGTWGPAHAMKKPNAGKRLRRHEGCKQGVVFESMKLKLLWIEMCTYLLCTT